MKKITGKEYDKGGFYWAVMYQPNHRCKPHITALYPRGRDAHCEVNMTNHRWKEQGLGENRWSVKRFRFNFRGNDIDAYEHEFFRTEKTRR